MSDDIQTLNLDARRRLEHGFRRLEVLTLEERLAALMGYERPDEAQRTARSHDTAHV